ncbi:MAG TPA: NADH-quinone oxidoreductase subunit NuoN [Mycobacteriales bacterium]|nr:NADH-quinone oxidoreductase subunit NuoN [Mycobacteriales bacterium]
MMTSAAAASIHAPSIAYAALMPVLIMLGVACAGVLVELAPREWRSRIQVPLAFGGCIAALIAVIVEHDKRVVTAAGALAIDGPALFIEGTLAILGALSVLLISERRLDSAGSALVASAAVAVGSDRDRQLSTMKREQTEAYPLFSFAMSGMMLFPSANNLLVMFVALEVLSLPLYLLTGLARRRRLLSQEAAVKYFLLGAFASAFFVYGLAMLYGYAGTVSLSGIFSASAGSNKSDTLLLVGFGMLVVGLLFKASVGPFHTWTPDVYQGAPTAITAFMGACTKIAAFGALLRVFYVAFDSTSWNWRPVMWGVAICSMLIGAIFGLTQTDVKRLLAYSSIAHAGFLVVGVIALNKSGVSGTLFYLLTYGIATIGGFAVVTLVRTSAGEATHLSQWAGLAKRSPIVAAVFTVLLLSFAGVPLTSGFIAKFVIFKAAVDAGLGPLVVVSLVASAIAAFFYLRIVVLMYFSDPPEDGPTVAVPSMATQIVLAFTAAATIFLGIVPQAILDVADKAAQFVS